MRSRDGWCCRSLRRAAGKFYQPEALARESLNGFPRSRFGLVWQSELMPATDRQMMQVFDLKVAPSLPMFASRRLRR